MSDEKRKRRDAKLSRWLKEILGRSAPIDVQSIDELAEGNPGKTNAEVLAEIVVREAVVNKERWAIELIADRTEGKPVSAAKDEGGDRTTEERIADVTVAHLNDLAARVGKPPVRSDDERADAGAAEPAERPDADRPRPRDRTAPPARGLLDLPPDGDHDSQDA
jgi:hypothetical protein